MLPHIDLHCDTLYRLSDAPGRFFATESDAVSHITFEGLRSSGTLLQCFAIFTDLCETPENAPMTQLNRQLTCFRHILSGSRGHLSQIRTASELHACIRAGKTGALLTLEESCLSSDPVSLLPDLHAQGVRIATLTWDYSTRLASAAVNAPPAARTGTRVSALFRHSSHDTGISVYGHEFLEEAERLGILLDVSHVSDRGFYDIATHSRRPFLASHSNARTIRNVPRNLSDAMLRILAARGGLVGLCLHEPFLTSTPCSEADVAEALLRHIKHIVSVAGSDVLSLGTDFDGTPGNRFIPNITHLPRLADYLEKAGYRTSLIEKLFYKNALRFFTENLPHDSQ